MTSRGARRVSVDRALLNGLLGCQAESRLAGPAPQDPFGQVGAHGRAVLETVARSAPDEPDVLGFGMTVDQEVAVRSVLVLAHARFQQWRFGESGKTAREERPHARHALRDDETIAAVGIEGLAVAVGSDLEAAALQIRNAVDLLAEVD